MAKIKSSEKIQRKQHVQEKINRKRTAKDKTSKIIAEQQKEIENLRQSNDEHAKEKREELERKLREQQDELEKMDIDIGDTEKEEKEIDAMEVDEEPEDDSDGQTAQGVASSDANAVPAGQDSSQSQKNQPKIIKREPANDDDTGDAGSEDPYEDEGDDEVVELSGLDVKAFKEAQGLDDTQCQVRAKKTNANGRDTVFTQYGPKSVAKFRIEPGSSVYYDQQDPNIPDVTGPYYRIGSMKQGKKWRYGKHNFDSIIAVAWKPTNEASPLNDIDPDLAKERKRYTETAVLIQWKDIDKNDMTVYLDENKSPRSRQLVNGKVRTWETRTVARRVFPIMKKGAADRALYLQAEKAEKAYNEWKEGGSIGRDETMTPAPLAPAKVQKGKRAVQFEGSTSTSTPDTTSIPTPEPKATSTPTTTTTTTTAPTPSDNAPAGTSKVPTPQEFVETWEKLWGKCTTATKKAEAVKAYREQYPNA